MSTMEAELVASALAMTEAVFCSNMLTELGFGTEFEQVRLHIDNTATLHVIGNRAFSSRTKHIALCFFYIRELVKENKLTTHYISIERQLAEASEQASSSSTSTDDQELLTSSTSSLVFCVFLFLCDSAFCFRSQDLFCFVFDFKSQGLALHHH